MHVHLCPNSSRMSLRKSEVQVHPATALHGAECFAPNHCCKTRCSCLECVRYQTSYPKAKKKRKKTPNQPLFTWEGRFHNLSMQLEQKAKKQILTFFTISNPAQLYLLNFQHLLPQLTESITCWRGLSWSFDSTSLEQSALATALQSLALWEQLNFETNAI